jgi:hypothetical protein
MKLYFAAVFILLNGLTGFTPGDEEMIPDSNISGAVYSPGPLSYASFRIIFGLKDKEPNSWDGEIMPALDQILEIEADQFRNHQYEAKGWSPGGITRIKLGDPTLPNDYLKNKTSWICSTRESPMHGPATEWHYHGTNDYLLNNQIIKPVILQPSILVHLRSDKLNQAVHIKTVRGDFNFIPQELISKRMSYFLEENIKVEVVPGVERVSSESNGQQDFPSLISSKSGKLWMAWQEYDDYSDKVLVRSRTGDTWSQVYVLAENADVFHTAMAEDNKNRIWVFWSMQVDGNWGIYGRFFDENGWSAQDKLTDSNAANNIYHKVVTDSEGLIWLVWQRISNRKSQIYAKSYNGSQWSQAKQVSEGRSASGNNWRPSVAAGTDGSIVIAWDGYASGSYDVFVRRLKNNAWEEVETVAGTARFEAHPSVAVDNRNHIWIAWDESGTNWGKDKGYLVVDRKATQVHESRSIGIACFDGKKWMTPEQELKHVLKHEEFWELPHLQIDQHGNPVLFARHMVMREPDTPLEGPIDLALFEIHVTQYNGSRWTDPVCLPHSTGRNDMMPATIMNRDGNIWAVWATDLRDRRSFQTHQLQVQLGKFDNITSEATLAMKPYIVVKTDSFQPFDPNEAEHIKTIRDYKIEISGKKYSIFRGDLHRHSDISIDGYNDGSLLDAYRYAHDAAELDFIGVSDHTSNVWDTYHWWRNQKVADIFQIKNSFVAFYGYERSVEYPNGHRNVFFTKRGVDIFPIDPVEANGFEGSGRLFWYLRRNNGFSIPHTTGRTSGTDWRDNDPDVESLIEIYQGMRDSYEYPGSPRPYKLYALPDSTLPVPRASSSKKSPSFKPLGFAWNALDKGYKLGFIASSDHISTHISYACFIAEELTPENLLEAIRARRTYAATDNIILDIKHKSSEGDHLMGEIFESKTPVKIRAKIIGTDEIRQIDIIKNSAIVHTYNPNKTTFSFDYVDNMMNDEENYFYLRVIQKDGEMAWGSPVWVTYKK